MCIRDRHSADVTFYTREWQGDSHSFVRGISSCYVLIPPSLKSRDSPSLQSVTKARQILNRLKIFFRYIKTTTGFHRMQKNSGGYITSIEVDTVTGEYRAIIPEWIINEMGWYEDTNLNWKIDDDDVIITESDE